ncbi:MAG: oligosaccharide flippase family protein, partial [Alphaproteobacteria bacterium]|nr:oligosaccharide flippase family protein [Alphaproteobacteria bacterium]
MTQLPPRHDFKSIGGAMARGAAWMLAMRWSLRLVGLINTIILARLLVPADFGVVAMATIVVGFVEMLSEANVDMALLRRADTARAHWDTAWTVQILTGLGATAALWLAAAPMATYYADPRVETVIQIVSLRAALIGFQNIGVVEFRRKLDFAREFRFWVWRRLSTVVLTLALVLAIGDWRALAWGMPLAALVSVALSFRMSDYRPRLSVAKFGEIWSFSRWLIVFNTAQFVSRRVDEFVVGGMAGATLMGHYYVASDVATMPTREVVLPVGRALIPTFAALSHDQDELWAAARTVLGVLALICFSTGVGLAMVAEDLVRVVLGARWLEAVPFFSLLALAGALEGIALGLQPYFVVRGHERAYAMANLAGVALLVPAAFAAGHLLSVEAVPLARIATVALMLGGLIVMLARVSGAGLAAVMAELWRPLAAAGAMAAALAAL